MATKDARVDAYIAKSAAFARPILESLRAQVHAACPDVVETIKWGMPFFEHHGLLCHMAAFKAHCAFGFWKHRLEVDAVASGKDAMGTFGRIESLDDLPSKAKFASLLRKAAAMNEAGVPAAQAILRKPKSALPIPKEFSQALEADEAAQAQFKAFTPGKQREYIEWIAEARTAGTRDKRIAQAIEWIAKGRSRNWKYQQRD